MATSKAVYRQRLTTLLRVIQQVPKRLVNLNAVGIYEYSEIDEHGRNFTHRDVIGCGSVGCLLGWAKTIPAARRAAAKYGRQRGTSFSPSFDEYARYYGQHAGFFTYKLDREQGSHHACAINRIKDALSKLKEEGS